MTSFEIENIKSEAYRVAKRYHLRDGQALHNAFGDWIREKYGESNYAIWRDNMPSGADCFYLDTRIEEFIKYCSSFQPEEITVQKWSHNLDGAVGKGEVWLAGYNNSDKTKWIEPAINDGENWLFTHDMKPIPEEVTPIMWSEKIYPNFGEMQGAKND